MSFSAQCLSGRLKDSVDNQNIVDFVKETNFQSSVLFVIFLDNSLFCIYLLSINVCLFFTNLLALGGRLSAGMPLRNYSFIPCRHSTTQFALIGPFVVYNFM